jgi:beta-N-acetylhexosaminidase
VKKLFILLAAVCSVVIAQPGSDTLKRPVDIFLEKNDPWVENILSKMSLEEKAGQLVFPHAYGRFMSEDTPQYQRLLRLVQEYKAGGLIFFLSSVYDQAITTNKLQQVSDIPLLVACDFERGVAQRAIEATMFPYNMGIGAADDISLTYQMGRIIALEGRALGVHQNYAPVADVNNNPLNPIINVRSFGEDVDLVTRHSNAFLRGVQDGGMIATTKHFPGHGNTASDSHLELPAIRGSREELDKTEFPPFSSNIREGVMSCMIAHLHVTALDQDKVLPSTLSPAVINGLLKKEMGFYGLVVTDAMNMHAITNNYSTAEATVLAVQAGNDAILFPDSAEVSILAIIEAVRNGILTEDRLDESVRKILLAKKYAGLDTSRITDIYAIAGKVGMQEHRGIALQLARKSITLLSDSEFILPLSKTGKTLHISVLDSDNERLNNLFEIELRRRNPAVVFRTLVPSSYKEEYNDVLTEADGYDNIIISAYLKVRAFADNLGLSSNQSEFISALLSKGKKVVFASHGSPYIVSLFDNVKTYICNYGDAEVSETALAEALYGETDITGKLPVTIPGTSYKYGDGIILNKAEEVQKETRVYNFSKVDKVVENGIKDSAFPGAVVAVVKDGKIIYEKAYGRHTYDKNSPPVTVNTIFDLASVSKVLATTTAVMICYDKGLFDIEERVTDYIPGFEQNGKGHILIKNLLLHNSGLPSWKQFYSMYKTEDEVLDDIYASSLEFKTGTKMLYSDLGMITVGKIIEKVTGKGLDDFCRDEIFTPLGMNNTYYNPPADLKNNIAPTELDNYWRKRQLQGEVHDETAAMLNGVAGHAGLFSTASDAAKIMQTLLQKGEYNSKQLIKPETVTLFTRKYSALSSRGLGWDTKSSGSSAGKIFSTYSFGHTGYTGTSVWADPLRNIAVVFFTNRVYPTRNNLKISRVRPLLHDAVISAIED